MPRGLAVVTSFLPKILALTLKWQMDQLKGLELLGVLVCHCRRCGELQEQAETICFEAL